MSIQHIANPNVTIRSATPRMPLSLSEKNQGNPVRFNTPSNLAKSSANCLDCSLTAEYYSSEKIFVEYESKDGDTVTLNIEQIAYQKAMTNLYADGFSDNQWKEIVQKIMDEFTEMRKTILQKFIDSIGGTTSSEKSAHADAAQESDEIPGLPEFWNAENTSQRIVDFALSFRALYAGSDEEYLNQVRQAVEEGFKQARDILGELPSAVNNLVNKTYDLVMKKFDTWLAQKGSEQAAPAEDLVRAMAA